MTQPRQQKQARGKIADGSGFVYPSDLVHKLVEELMEANPEFENLFFFSCYGTGSSAAVRLLRERKRDQKGPLQLRALGHSR